MSAVETAGPAVMGAAFVQHASTVMLPDPSRVVTTLFLPGQELLIAGQSRASAVISRALALSDQQVDDALTAALDSFRGRHRDLVDVFESRFDLVAHRVPDAEEVSAARRRLVGAYFSQEYSVEAAAVCNPSMVPHPDQSGLEPGTVRFVMSLRAIGEGHISSIEFRTGTIDASDQLTFDLPAAPLEVGEEVPTTYSRVAVARTLADQGVEDSPAEFVLDDLPSTFTQSDLDRAFHHLRAQRLTRGAAALTGARLERFMACHYSLRFPADSILSSRVIRPRSPSESHGMEDARFVQVVDDDSSVLYHGTYTAYDGHGVEPQLITTSDFGTFHVSQLSGPAAKNKGMALFPRLVDGAQLALTRWDRETNSIASSVDLHHWELVAPLNEPFEPWEIVQMGNCGPPMETPAGWLVLTHGVGPMREYSIGAILLDLDDPSRVIGRLSEPILRPARGSRDGYVANVVYSCGGMLHGDTLVLPYGCNDSSIRVALVPVPALLSALVA